MPATQTEAQVREYARCSVDFPRFVDEYAVIYDKDQGLGFIPFKLWQGQKWLAWVIVTLRMILLLKARQLGATWLVCAYVAWKMLYQRGFTCIVISKADEEAMEFVTRVEYILKNLPEWMRPKLGGNQHHLKVLDVEGEVYSDCIAKASGKDAGRSLTCSLLVLDEFAFQQWARDIWAAAYATFSRPTGGQVIVLSTMRLGTLFAEWCRAAIRKQGDGIQKWYFAFLPWWVRPDRDAAWYVGAKDALKDDVYSEYPSSPEEAFRARTGRLVPEYDEDLHYIEPFAIPAEWQWRWLTCRDPGATAPTAVLLAALNPSANTLYFVDEIYMPGARVSEVVAEERKLRHRWGIEPAQGGQRVWVNLIDPSADATKTKEVASDLTLYRQEFQNQKIPGTIMAANNEPGINRLRERFKPYEVPDDSPGGSHLEAKAYVFKNCVHLNEQLLNLVWDEPRFEGENVTTWSGADHSLDCARYISNWLWSQPGGTKGMLVSPLAAGGRPRRRREDDDDEDDDDEGPKRPGFYGR